MTYDPNVVGYGAHGVSILGTSADYDLGKGPSFSRNRKP